jgi:hypothetical protein
MGVIRFSDEEVFGTDSQEYEILSKFVFDDIWMYDHDKLVEEKIFEAGFELREKGKVKASYTKVK